VKSYTAAQVKAAEAPLLEAGVPLMARASAALARVTTALVAQRRGEVRGAKLLVLAGAGNNGGDALYAAAILAGQGAAVTIVPTAARLHEGGLAAVLEAGAVLLVPDAPDSALIDEAAACDVIFDGILGTGSSENPALRGRAREVVSVILPVLHLRAEADKRAGHPEPATNASVPLVVAVDIPSGIGPDDGAVPDPTVLKADVTVTFGGCKTGLLREPGATLAGRVIVADIGLTAELERVAAQHGNSP
jgi:NAD(P)H-hydrate epimerase